LSHKIGCCSGGNMDSVVQNENGRISVFGSHTMRVEPDMVSLKFSISQDEKKAKDAIREARKLVSTVQSYLTRAQVNNVGVSHIHLGQHYVSKLSGHRPDGYTATFRFHVILNDINRFEDILVGLVDTDVNNIQSVDFQTSKLKEVRMQARQQAIHAAREKAQIYCDAANVELGKVIQIDDQNPDMLQNAQRFQGHTPQPQPLDSGYIDDVFDVQAINPASIVVSAAVKVVFELQ